MNSTEMITNSINAFSFIDGLKFLSLILLATSVITSCLGKDGYMSGMPKLTWYANHIIIKKMNYSLVHQHHQRLQNEIYKELKKVTFTG